VLDTDVIEAISDEMRAVVEAVWPELADPLSGLWWVDRLPRLGVRVRARRAATASGAGSAAMTKKNPR
jgi:hypothetical protein